MDLPWHQPSKASLSIAHRSGRLPHALLVSSYPGWGATELGNWLALEILDYGRSVDARRLAHPDFRWVAPERSVIPVDAVRRLCEFGQGAPQMAAAKAMVVEDADCMNINAANALLKFLEEPPRDTHLILTSHRAGALPATIRSRCQKVIVSRDVAAARAWLTDGKAQSLLDDYDGAPLLAAAGAADGERPMVQVLAELRSRDPERQKQVLDELLGLDPVRLSARWMRCLLAAMTGCASPLSTGADRATFAFLDELMWFHLQVSLSSSVNLRLWMERLCHRWRDMAGSDR